MVGQQQLQQKHFGREGMQVAVEAAAAAAAASSTSSSRTVVKSGRGYEGSLV